MKYLVKQAQNLVPGSDTGSGWSFVSSLYRGDTDVSPFGNAFTIIDSTGGNYAYLQYAFTNSGSQNDEYTLRHVFKSQASSSSVVSRIVLNSSPAENIDLQFLPDRPNLFRTFTTGSCSVIRASIAEVASPWFAIELSARRDTSSATAGIIQIFPAASLVNSLTSYTNSGIGSVMLTALQVTKEGRPGPYLRTTTSAVSAAPDYVLLNPSAQSFSTGMMAKQHRAGQGTMTRQVYGTFKTEKVSDRCVSQSDALKINCWWENNVAVWLQDTDLAIVSSGFIVNKTIPAKGFAEPYTDQYEVLIELEGF